MLSLSSRNRFILTGAPGVGKTSLINELVARGFNCVNEPAREIIAEQRAIDGAGVWDRDTKLFLELLLSRSIARYRSKAPEQALFIYDRGIPDCIAYAQCAGLTLQAAENAARLFRYENTIFIAPPWEEIYRTDEERRMTYEATCSFHECLMSTYTHFGYQIQELPKVTVRERADFLCEQLSQSSGILYDKLVKLDSDISE